jgi:long-chain fatty acid transport protein
MRKILTIISAIFITGSLFAGGLVTNTNQSASWVRMPSRNASIEIDAAYFNPAGLMKLDNGFHFSLNNQTIFQTRTVESTYPYLNSGTFKGTITAPFFPSIYAVYKLDKLAFSVGFMPIGGGGGATYEDGLPSFEMSQSDLVPALAAKMGATAYKMDVYFKGSQTNLGFQGAVSYKLNDWISVAAGARYVTANYTYEGFLKDVQVNIASGWTDASTIMTGIAGQYTTGASQATAVAVQTTGLVTAGAGTLTLAQAEAASIITTQQRLTLEGYLTAFGLPITGTISVADAGLKGTAIAYSSAATGYNNKSTILSDQEAFTEQTGSGITPFFSVNISPVENLNIAIKYEMATKLELTNKTSKELITGFLNEDPTKPITKFPNGAKIRSDMPAMLAVGAEVRLPIIKINVGGNYFFDKSADYGHYVDLTPQNSTDYLVHIDNSEIIDQNGMSLQAGVEIALTEKLLASAGYVYANKGVNSLYQSDLTYGLSTQTIGAGGAFLITDNIKINIGGSFTMYKDDSKNVNHYLGSLNLLPTETYKKTAMVLGLGLDFSF